MQGEYLAPSPPSGTKLYPFVFALAGLAAVASVT
jgi:hypothetical protein